MDLLKISQLSKSFGGVPANQSIDLEVRQGEIHALVGENGAGKSTLMKLLLGILKADRGEIFFKGQALRHHNPIQAAKLGMGMVHQHFMLADSLSVIQNVLLFEPNLAPLKSLPLKSIQEKYDPIARLLKFEVPWHAQIQNLSVAMQQKVEILKVLAQNPDLIIFDEPTAVLTPQESDELLNQFLQLKAQGKTILFISHKLKEVKKVADRVSILRHGKRIGTYEVKNLDLQMMAHLMIGSEIKPPQNLKIISTNSEPLLSLENFNYEHNLDRLQNFSMSLYPGEILGALGVEGNGQSALIEGLASRQKQLSLSILPDDRLRNGLYSRWPAWKDLALSLFSKNFRFRLISSAEWIAHCFELMKKHDVRPQNPSLMLQSFSGGNQQKYVVGRDLMKEKNILVAPHPTRGVDIGAAQDIHNELLKLRSEGKSILLITSDLDEAFKLCDRVFVLFKGKNILELERNQFHVDKIGCAMGGILK